MAEALPLIDRITADSSMSTLDRNLEVSFGDGYKQEAPDGLNSQIETWKLRFAPIEGVDLTTMLAFLAIVGTTEWFTWTPLGETVSKKWSIKKDSIKKNMINTTKFIYSFEIEQNFSLG